MNSPALASTWDAAQARYAEAQEAVAVAELDGAGAPEWATNLLADGDRTPDPRPTAQELNDARDFLANAGPAPSGDGATDAWEAAWREATATVELASDLGVRADGTADALPTLLLHEHYAALEADMPTATVLEDEQQAESALIDTGLVLRETGEVFDLAEPRGCVEALAAIQRLTGALHDARNAVVSALVDHRRQLGTSTFATPAGKVTLSSGEERVVDAERLRAGLEAAGAPETLIDEIIVATVTHKVDLRRADRAASNNAEYAHALADATEIRPSKVTARLDQRAATVE